MSQVFTVRMNHYEAASHGRRLMGWRAPGTGPLKAAGADLPTLRNRSRDACRNDPLAAAIVRAWVSSLVGYGIVPRVQTDDRDLRDRIETLWREWVAMADADGAVDFYGLQALAVRAFVSAGEAFIRLRWRRLSDGLPAPLQVQLLEPDMVPLFDCDSWPGMAAGSKIRQGVEFDLLGRRVAYWFHKEHPGDSTNASVGIQDLNRIPAEQVMHLFNPERPGQIRGVPLLAPILTRLRLLGDFQDATAERARLANLFALFIKRPPTSGDATIDPMTGRPIEYAPNGAPMALLEPGIAQELMPGEEVQFSNPPQPGSEFSEFVRDQVAAIAAGVGGMPAFLLHEDLRDVSDRTLRVLLGEWRRHCEQIQWQIIIPKFCRPIRDAWTRAAQLAGLLPPEEASIARNCEWTPPRHSHLHPVQDVEGLKLEVEAGFRSRASVISEYGFDAVDVDLERAADAQRAAELGLKTVDDLEAEKLAAEIAAAEAAAKASGRQAVASEAAAKQAQALAEQAKAATATIDATRPSAIAEAKDRASVASDNKKVAQLEVEATRIDLAELRAMCPNGSAQVRATR